MKYSYILFFFFLSTAHAQECPSISGTFNCQSGTGPYNIQMQTQESGYGAAQYTFQSPAQGVTEFIADGQEQSIKTTGQSGEEMRDKPVKR
jgi:endonuclease/exonuclease/phosphatase family metal-dependent hydrolase